MMALSPSHTTLLTLNFSRKSRMVRLMAIKNLPVGSSCTVNYRSELSNFGNYATLMIRWIKHYEWLNFC
jgi:hypothetical protein